MEPKIGITREHRENVIGLLGPVLANEYVLYTKTRNFHWNVKGPLFHDLHKFFESQYSEIEESIDEIAERIVTLGGVAPGSLAEMLKLTTLKEIPGGSMTPQEMVEALLADHEHITVNPRKAAGLADDQYGDLGTGDFLVGLMQEHEKMAWMLRSMAQ